MILRRPAAQTDTVARYVLDCLGMRLQHLRSHRGTTQSSLAEALKIGQTALSHLERRDDILLSTLLAYIRALGGDLHIAATFPDAEPIKLLGHAGWMPAAGADREANPKQLWPSRDIIFSVRPPHAEKILDGSKTVELRRRFRRLIMPGTLALIYTTSPTSALTGFATIQDVQLLALTELWKRHRSAACLAKGDFEEYFSGLKRGYAIVLESARTLGRPVKLHELRKRFGFEPPQSYQYASPSMRGLIEHEWAQTPN
jgi:predicted transcriptional regulator/DNA-binding XRE family transcriptional regulator